MRLRHVRASLLIVALAIPALAAPRHSVTVLLDFDQPHSDDSVRAMRAEAQHLLTGSGIDLDVKLRSEVPANAEFSDVLVFKMTGRCTMDLTPVDLTPVDLTPVDPAPILLDERGPLAEA